MPDVLKFATTGVTFFNGSAIGYISRVGPMTNLKKINPPIEQNVFAIQSGILDTRFDDAFPSGTTYYTA
jgi:hypothetical protein